MSTAATVLATTAMLWSPSPASAAEDNGPPERIEFARGTSGTTVEDAVVAGAKDLYVLTAAAAQVMSVSVSGGAVAESATGSGMLIAPASPSWSATLPVDGDYYIAVSSPTTTAYALTVSIVDGATGAAVTTTAASAVQLPLPSPSGPMVNLRRAGPQEHL